MNDPTDLSDAHRILMNTPPPDPFQTRYQYLRTTLHPLIATILAHEDTTTNQYHNKRPWHP